MKSKPTATIRSRTLLHEGFLRVYRYETEVERHQGGVRRLSWEVMERGNAVAVLGHDPKRGEIVLANEFRPGALAAGDYPYRDNLVAGVIEDGETALDAAVREMQEESGADRPGSSSALENGWELPIPSCGGRALRQS